MLFSLYCAFPLTTIGAVVGAMGPFPLASSPGNIEPRGELARRMEMARDRLLHGDVPRFTDEFILADVTLSPDYPRRFAEYSGDLSGRFIEAFATLGDAESVNRLDGLVRKLISHQKADGRFGNADLKFSPEEIALDHMALLWGNGRLLVGLMTYYRVRPDKTVLETCRRLGDFLLIVHEGCANERVTTQVKDLGAAGMICFSQLIEGLVMLAKASGDTRYLAAAEQIVPWFPRERGKQHSHGYLTTLRALILLHEATGNSQYLSMAEDLYASLAGSADYLVYGGVREYFGGKGDRDEGCSEADFVRLSLQLREVTGKMEYLERAERCLLNHLFANQFATGDFGHHVLFAQGVAPEPGAGRAWWCCTMHGLRALRSVLDLVVTAKDKTRFVNLFLDAEWSDETSSLALSGDPSRFAIAITRATGDGVRVAARRPTWADAVHVTVNGQPIVPKEENGYLRFNKTFQQNDRIELAFALRARILKRDGTWIAPDQLADTPTEGALFYGPWLLGVDEADNPLFFGEPWQGNQILLPREISSADTSPQPLQVSQAHISCDYAHEGFPGRQPVVLRPISERTGHEPMTFAVWLNYCRGN